MPPKTAEPARAASEAAAEGGGPPTDTSAAAANTGSSTKPTKTSKKAMGKTGKGKTGAAEPEAHPCFHCHSEGARMCCSQCHLAWYCGKACQKKHWKQHKRACVGAVAAEARQATLRRKATAARGGGGVDKDTCVICIGPVVAPVELPCGHAYCGACLAELRAKKVAQACPMCRMDLPPGVDGLYELAARTILRIEGMVTRGQFKWDTLPATEREEIDEAAAMLTETVAQGRKSASYLLGFLYRYVEKDLTAAEAAYRTAIAANPLNSKAVSELGMMLLQGGEYEKATAVQRAALALKPGDKSIHNTLGLSLTRHALEVSKICVPRTLSPEGVPSLSGDIDVGALRTLSEVWDEAVASMTIAHGADSETTRRIRAERANHLNFLAALEGEVIRQGL